jgi:hypothetical protein
MTAGRFSLRHGTDRYADIVDDRGTTVGSIYEGHHHEPTQLYVNGEAIGALTTEDLTALQQLMAGRVIDREYGS